MALLELVSKENVPDFYDYIQDPIDMKSIEKKSQRISTYKRGIHKGFKRIFTNARSSNK